ncbi:hypothetical protein SCP_0605220 [Sparassis crispa]|uniref:RING-type domain-containing protein n=1 Tax=Sparassis crispa TaxID=139825 RepID=A0A401GQQ0_9APHY|nr:hypothetical protein SCP_0605220 [Sparassis crispa]GBE84543.1 hypothetical protein SCP_0605220 [Sparassis crispa]
MDSEPARSMLENLRELLPFPLVRYIPAEEFLSGGGELQPVDWEDSDLPDLPLEDHNSRCYYCLDDYQPPRRKSAQHVQLSETAREPLTRFPCGHVLHQDCARAWIGEHSKCVLCKSDLYPSECVQEGISWSSVSNIFRVEDGIFRRVVDVELLHTVHTVDKDLVISGSFSEDGQYMRVQRGSGMYVIHTTTGSEICSFMEDGLSTHHFSPDGTVLVTENDHGDITIWKIQPGHNEKIRTLIGRKGMTMHVWDVASGQPMQIMQLQNESSSCLACHGGFVAVAKSNGTIELWDVGNGSLMNYWRGHDSRTRGLVFMPDGTGLVSAAAQEDPLKYWDMTTILDRGLTSPAFSRDHQVSQVTEGLLNLSPTRMFTGAKDPFSPTVSHDGCWLACCDFRGEAVFCGMSRQERCNSSYELNLYVGILCVIVPHVGVLLKCPSGTVIGIDFNQERSCVVTFNKECTIQTWKITTFNEKRADSQPEASTQSLVDHEQSIPASSSTDDPAYPHEQADPMTATPATSAATVMSDRDTDNDTTMSGKRDNTGQDEEHSV